jgi:hypothetical protein
MQQFALYTQAWALYLVLGLVLLFLVDLKLRHTGFKRRVALLSLLAVGAFTPQTVLDADTLAPLILTMLLNAEVQGLPPIIEGLITLVIAWGLVFFSCLAVRQLLRSLSTNKVVKNAESTELNQEPK